MNFTRPEIDSWPRRVATRAEIAIRAFFRRPRSTIAWPPWRSLMIAAAGFIALFLLSMMMFDVTAITYARGLPPAVVAVFREITDLGKAGWFLYTLPVLLFAIALAPSHLPRAAQMTLGAIFARAGFIFLSIGLPYWLNGIFKQMIGRARPFVGGSANAYLYRPFSWGPEYASLPSNHAVTVCAAAIAIGALWPRARTFMWIYAAVIMLSRVVVIAHHPSDVIAGALVGVCGALLVRNYFASRRLVFGVTPQGAVEAFAGPSWRRIKATGRALLSDN